MKKYYFVGGPKKGFVEEFFQRLDRIGGSPSGWSIYPHVESDGKALHIVNAKSRDEVLEHLEQFNDIYDRSEIIEIIENRGMEG
ncbi:MAG: hypothetical protein ACOY46_15010 [Bacillota bacterium]